MMGEVQCGNLWFLVGEILFYVGLMKCMECMFVEYEMGDGVILYQC